MSTSEKCGDALRLRCNGRCGWQVKLCDPLLTLANMSALEMSRDKMLYKSTVTLTLFKRWHIANTEVYVNVVPHENFSECIAQ